MATEEQVNSAMRDAAGRMSSKRMVFYRTHWVMTVVVLVLTAAVTYEVSWKDKDLGPNFVWAYCAIILAYAGHATTGYMKRDQLGPEPPKEDKP